MNRTLALSISILLLAVSGITIAQEKAVDKVTVELTDPSKPVFLSENGFFASRSISSRILATKALTSIS